MTSERDEGCGIDWESWQPLETAVLTYIRSHGRVLLIEKKRGLGAGKISAPGGRLEPGETLEAAAVRETVEEVGLKPANLKPAGRLDFVFKDGYSMRCHVFITGDYSGELVESDEAAPFWCAEDELPYARMWADDILWVPLMLAGRSFEAQFVFDGDTMLWHRLNQTR